MKDEALKDKILEALKNGKNLEFPWGTDIVTVKNKTLFLTGQGSDFIRLRLGGDNSLHEVAHYIPFDTLQGLKSRRFFFQRQNVR